METGLAGARRQNYVGEKLNTTTEKIYITRSKTERSNNKEKVDAR